MPGANEHGRVPISICIATYRRPELLGRLLEGLSALALDTPRFEVVVVDNDKAGSAAATVAPFAERLTLCFAVEPRRSIAHARNRSVAMADGEYVAFIDDDQVPDTRWLAELHTAVVTAGADGGFGPVDYEFEHDVPVWIRGCWLFRRLPLPTGAPVPWWLTRTGNALIRRTSLPSLRTPFNERFGLTGGEDVDLFYRMIQRGARFISVASARVVESRSRVRCSAQWMLKRSFRTGGTIVDVAWRDRRGRARYRAAYGAGRNALAQGARALRHVRTLDRAFEHLLNALQSLGMLAAVLGYHYPEYRRPR